MRNLRIGGFLGIERKFLDTAWNAVSISESTDGANGEMQPSSGCTGAISVPSQGDGESNRDGRRFVLKSAFVSGVVDTASAGDQADVKSLNGWYFALVLDRQANGATIDSEDIFVNPSSSALGMIPQPLRNLQNSKRFRILDAKYVRPGGAYAGTDGTATNSIDMQVNPIVKLSWSGNLVVDCTGTTADVASVSNNALHLVAYNGTASGGAATFTGKARVRFVG